MKTSERRKVWSIVGTLVLAKGQQIYLKQRRLCHLSLTWGRLCHFHGSEAFGSLTGLCSCQQHAFTQDFIHPIPTSRECPLVRTKKGCFSVLPVLGVGTKDKQEAKPGSFFPSREPFPSIQTLLSLHPRQTLWFLMPRLHWTSVEHLCVLTQTDQIISWCLVLY